MAKDLPRSAATALVALVQKISLREEVDEAELTQLIEAVCQTPQERSTLLMALRQANDPDLRVVLSDRLRTFATQNLSNSEGLAGRDSAVGPWMQGFTGSLVVLALGSTLTGTLSPVVAVPAVLIGTATLGLITWLRLRNASRRSAAKRNGDLAGDLLKTLADIRPDSADPPKSNRN
ncbi:hypothetical protein GU927_011150 [Rhodobacteraceae bacterium HSP-20]|uniref:Uncharacterized protein n=1 Tax=Paragemmobacter amnigenus TaxID=2852097 RepID=A0ABS6J581_9RHOB|nr:hypothetical protein [Rhodobacter amnigenus]MBU9698401.1 hypothetical protein [Rhodobacter amnigenus]MBV4389628.1 hypothetical protein [Rhodobacter amnigenus]